MKRIPDRASMILSAALLVAALLACLGGPYPTAQAAEPPASTTAGPAGDGPLVAEGQPTDLAIISTGSVVGYVEPCG